MYDTRSCSLCNPYNSLLYRALQWSPSLIAPKIFLRIFLPKMFITFVHHPGFRSISYDWSYQGFIQPYLRMPGYVLWFEYLMQSMVTPFGCYNTFLYFLWYISFGVNQCAQILKFLNCFKIVVRSTHRLLNCTKAKEPFYNASVCIHHCPSPQICCTAGLQVEFAWLQICVNTREQLHFILRSLK
jgi:hypothetical protein